jgi:hypothetical protein
MKSWDALYSQPIEFDFQTNNNWETVTPDPDDMEPEDIHAFVNTFGDIEAYSFMDADDQETYLEALIGENFDYFEPMINILYPLPGLNMEPTTAQVRLIGLNVVIVLVDEKPYLALSACGVNLSWDICYAYITLGYHPPILFSDLPDMGLSHDRKEIAIIAAMITSVERARCHQSQAISCLRDLEAQMIARETRGKQ